MQSDIDRIISSYLRNEITEEDEQSLNRWLEEDVANRELFESLSRIWETSLGYPDVVNMEDERQKLWKRLNNNQDHIIPSYNSKGHWLGRMIKYAAVIIVFFSFGHHLLTRYLQTKKPENKVLIQKVEHVNPPGQRSRILLQDGSIVWLNAASKLTYSTDFNKSTRDIQLEGEAYFEVAKNPDKPFKVSTNSLIITAVGTSFNVQSYSNNRIERVALNTGKVKIETINMGKKNGKTYLSPGQMVVYDPEKMDLKKIKFNGEDPFGWKDGRIVFYHATFKEVRETLARWYNVDIKVTGHLQREWDYSTSFENESLENILKSLKFSENIDYSLSGSKVEIKL